jgi:DMSO/TMAO reductase YedYZ molybdopterin-dependent catalytic subunit
MPRVELTATTHNHAGGDATSPRQAEKYSGVSLRELLTRVGVPTGADLRGAELAKTVIVTGADGYRVAFAMAELDPGFTERVCILADRRDDAPLPANAAPFQVILSGELRPARWVRQVVSIEVRPAP